MIHLHKITVQNFLSYGNTPTEILLDAHKTTLVVGKNGGGKSSILTDGICFALFGKPYRNINKPQLINSINNKALKVELEFSINGVPHRIVRGMKPNIFEIYKEDKLIDQDAAMLDYQDYLEKVILKTSFRTFTQVCILGSAAHTPFMQLNAISRRQVIEDILDIGVFSEMNALLKDRIAATKEELNSTNLTLEKAHGEAKASQRVIATLEEVKKSALADLESQLESLEHQRKLAEDILETLKVKEEQIGYDQAQSRANTSLLRKLNGEMMQMESKIADLKKKIHLQTDLSNCPVCTQELSPALNQSICHVWHQELHQLQIEIATLRIEFEKASLESTVWEERYDQLQKVENETSKAKAELDRIDREILVQRGKIVAAKQDDVKLESERAKSRQIAKYALDLITRKEQLINDRQVQDVTQLLLRDTGIRAAIIKEYLPLLNKLINKYLQHFDFFVNFTLDENFNETIKSRGRDTFSYANFSEGEKKRIDVAILFAFRQLASAKNSVRCNLLVCDEIVDSSLDLIARDNFTALIAELPGTDTWVISHTDTNPENYHAVMKVEKRGDFSYMERIS